MHTTEEKVLELMECIGTADRILEYSMKLASHSLFRKEVSDDPEINYLAHLYEDFTYQDDIELNVLFMKNATAIKFYKKLLVHKEQQQRIKDLIHAIYISKGILGLGTTISRL